MQDAIATPEDQRTPGQVLLADQVIRGVSVSDSRDRIASCRPEDKAEKQRILKLIADAGKAASRADSGGHGGDRRRLPFHSGWSR